MNELFKPTILRIHLSIYDYHVIFCAGIAPTKEVIKEYKLQGLDFRLGEDVGGSTFAYDDRNVCVVCIPSFDEKFVEIMVHELHHVVYGISRAFGIECMEGQAYLMSYLFKIVIDGLKDRATGNKMLPVGKP